MAILKLAQATAIIDAAMAEGRQKNFALLAVAVTVTYPVYVPAVRLPTFAEIANVPGVEPLLGVAPSQAEELESVLAVKPSAPPPPVFVRLMDVVAGFTPP